MSISIVTNELEKLFSIFNKHYFNNELETPIITVSPENGTNSYGWFTTWRAWDDGSENGRYEINICAEHLNRPIQETIGTLLHEMVHLFNKMNDVQDCSRSGTYHNKRFKTAAEEHGLVVHKTSKYGFSKTELSDEAITFVDELNVNQMMLSRKAMPKSLKVASSSKSEITTLSMPNVWGDRQSDKRSKHLMW